MTDDEDETPKPEATPHPRYSPRLKYVEQKEPDAPLPELPAVPLAKKNTGSISLDEIRREVKRTAKDRPRNWAATIGSTLALLGGGGTATYLHGDDDRDLQRRLRAAESQVEKLRDRVQEQQVDLAKCCR